MKQVIQNARTGELEIVEVPTPSPARGQILVRNHFSVVSTGTETLSLEFARMTMLAKARSRPDLTRQVIRKLREEGPLPTYRTVMTRLDAPQPLGYSSAGVVEAVGEGVSAFAVGDRVACAGAGYANHAEFVVIPALLATRVPETVATEDAAFATIGAIAMQGLRIAAPTLGDVAAVIGLGLLGQLSVQMLRANGCRVLGVDLDPKRVKQGVEQGAEWGSTVDELGPRWKDEATHGFGADLALVTASAQTSAPLQLAADLCRAKGRIAVVGAMPMELDRRTFYEKELDLRMSMSYGPGRYDRSYEEQGIDYPLPYVRWTENRNLQAFVQLVAAGSVRPSLLEPKILPFSEALDVYERLASGRGDGIAALFRYDVRASAARSVALQPATHRAERKDRVGVAFLGAGNYAKAVLLPALAKHGDVERDVLVTATGASARRSAERFAFRRCATDPEEALGAEGVDLVFIATRHDSHAELAVRALRAGKAVWLEKPVAIRREELDEVIAAAAETGGFLSVGYNRRFSAHARAIREFFDARQGALAIRYCVAAGPPPRGTWITDPESGGGRVLGEVCHFVDLCTYLVGERPSTVYARALGRDPQTDDSTIATLGYPDGSTAVVEYLASAWPELPKERFEASADGRTARCDNYRVTELSGHGGVRTLNQDKGQASAITAVVDALKAGEASPIPLDEIESTSRVTFAMLESVRSGAPVRLEG